MITFFSTRAKWSEAMAGAMEISRHNDGSRKGSVETVHEITRSGTKKWRASFVPLRVISWTVFHLLRLEISAGG
jgi:hypothetical protein